MPGEHLADGDEVTLDIDADRDGRQRAANVRVTAAIGADKIGGSGRGIGPPDPITRWMV
jgi:hypothetical protein